MSFLQHCDGPSCQEFAEFGDQEWIGLKLPMVICNDCQGAHVDGADFCSWKCLQNYVTAQILIRSVDEKEK